MPPTARSILVTGAAGYLGRGLVPLLHARGHRIVAVVRRGPRRPDALPSARLVEADPLVPASLRAVLSGPAADCSAWVQLVGTPRPAPWKTDRFRSVDLRAVTASLEALSGSAIRHYLYLSVAQPLPVMRAYAAIRAEAESRIRAAGLAATFLRPFYVLGPGHRWPHLLRPLYALAEALPATHEGALRAGLVTLPQMLAALVAAVENPPPASDPIRILDVPAIRAEGGSFRR